MKEKLGGQLAGAKRRIAVRAYRLTTGAGTATLELAVTI